MAWIASDGLSAEALAEAVAAYNGGEDGKKDAMMWSQTVALLDNVQTAPQGEQLVDFGHEVRIWGSVQGLSHDDARKIADCVAKQWPEIMALPHPAPDYSPHVSERVLNRVQTIVDSAASAGSGKRHWSFTSKVLHWLRPAAVPVYDSFVRELVAQNREKEVAFEAIINWEYEQAAVLEPLNPKFVGDIGPQTTLRAIDKFLWFEQKRRNG